MPEIWRVLGLGQFAKNSHPVHPATVHLPIAFLLASSALDLFTYFGSSYPTLLAPIRLLTTNSSFPNKLDDLALLRYSSLFSFASTVAAVVTSFPALSSGVAEGYALIKANGLDLSNPKVSTLVIHALLNDVAIAGAVYNWWSKSKVDGYFPTGVNAGLSAVLIGGLIYSAALGGELVYKYGVGVQRQGEGKEIKEAALAKERAKGAKGL